MKYSAEHKKLVAAQYVSDPEVGSIKLAKLHGISQVAVVRWVHQVAGRSKMRRRGRPALSAPSRRAREILEMLNYASMPTVAKYFGISRVAVWRHANRWKEWRPTKKNKSVLHFQVGDEVEFDFERYQVVEASVEFGTLMRKRDGMIFPRFYWVQAQRRCQLVRRQKQHKPLVNKG